MGLHIFVTCYQYFLWSLNPSVWPHLHAYQQTKNNMSADHKYTKVSGKVLLINKTKCVNWATITWGIELGSSVRIARYTRKKVPVCEMSSRSLSRRIIRSVTFEPLWLLRGGFWIMDDFHKLHRRYKHNIAILYLLTFFTDAVFYSCWPANCAFNLITCECVHLWKFTPCCRNIMCYCLKFSRLALSVVHVW